MKSLRGDGAGGDAGAGADPAQDGSGTPSSGNAEARAGDGGGSVPREDSSWITPEPRDDNPTASPGTEKAATASTSGADDPVTPTEALKTPHGDQTPTPVQDANDATPTPPPVEPTRETPSTDDGASENGALAKALAIVTTEPLAARTQLTRLLDGSTLSGAERLRAYAAINEVNQPLFFRSGVVQGDTVFRTHRVEEGETPTSIVRALGAECESDLLVRVNGVKDARRIRVGQVLKVPTGTFHAEIRKGEYRLNLYHGEAENRVMIASFPVGLGESNTTPTGIFKVRPKSKLKNPQWTNPRTSEFFAANDPKNPIGERWIGLEGVEPHNRDFLAYGIHGTIEPESIGQMMSMGCVRMRAPDVEVVYEVLSIPNSTVLIAP